MMKLFSKNPNLCDHNSPTLQTDRQTTCDRNTALCTKVHRVVKMVHGLSTIPFEDLFEVDNSRGTRGHSLKLLKKRCTWCTFSLKGLLMYGTVLMISQ